ncbi:MAG: SIR2 family protein [candidate division Zixibacteria bacterium]
MDRIAFLLGAGASIPAGMPSTTKINKAIKNMIEEHDDVNHDIASKICSIVFGEDWQCRLIKNDFNYEDIYYIFQQLGDHEGGEYENPLTKIVIESLIDNKPICIAKTDIKCCSESMIQKIIECVRDCILLEDPSFDKLQILNDILNLDSFGNIDIFSLNHDLVIEKLLKEEEINDGFEEIEGEKYKGFNPKLFSDPNGAKINFLKLHGSVDWCYNQENYKKYTVVTQQAGHSYDIAILTGTFNKLLDYNLSVYFHLFCSFYNLLTKNNLLIIIGYSFNDKGVNARLINWMHSGDDKIILIIDSNENVICNGREAIKNLYREYCPDRIKEIYKPIEEVTMKDIRQEIKDWKLF